jgi:hypothetical protein
MIKITGLSEQLPALIFRVKITSTLKAMAKLFSDIENIHISKRFYTQNGLH